MLEMSRGRLRGMATVSANKSKVAGLWRRKVVIRFLNVSKRQVLPTLAAYLIMVDIRLVLSQVVRGVHTPER